VLRAVLYRLILYFMGVDGLFLFKEYFAVKGCFLAVLVLVLVFGMTGLKPEGQIEAGCM